MTFTVLGFCADTGQVGIGIATASIAVGGLCPFISRHGDVVSSQAFARPELGLAAVRHLDAGNSLAALPQLLNSADDHFEFRQIGVMLRTGAQWAHTGGSCRPWAGHRSARGCVAMGNFLADAGVVDEMLEAFVAGDGAPLAERLLRALEAARDAGGQADANGHPVRERSAALLVAGGGQLADIKDAAVTPVNVRIDLHEEAVTALRTLYRHVRKVADYNTLRSAHPASTPGLTAWEAEQLDDVAVPSVIHPDR
jgi:uncharacterized Ntn-hydrolase superfamily protein